MLQLPVDRFEKEILDSLRRRSSLVLSAQTGTGKSTRVPQFLLRGLEGQILLLEPRRVAARSIAARIATELKVPLGGAEVGYQIRFDNRSQPGTRLKIITEGVLLQILQSNPFLEGISAVVLDEFHERNVFTDLGLACCREIQKNLNPDLKIVVMSATLDSPKVAEFLGAEILEIPGQNFAVDVIHSPPPDKRSREKFLDQKVEERLASVLKNNPEGDVLIFLPGWGEIQRALDTCRALESKYRCRFLALHGSLEAKEQDLIFQDTPERKVIFSTNVAETSLTIPGVKVVIDAGLEKNPDFDADLKVSKIKLERISLFSAKQRAGRAGRTSNGKCYRLWSEEEEEQMDLETTPQIKNSDLSGVLLQLLNWRGDLKDFSWFENPPKQNLQKAWEFLEDLAFTQKHAITDEAKRSLSLPFSLRSRKILGSAIKSEAVSDLRGFLSKYENIPYDQLSKILDKYLKQSPDGLSFAQALLLGFPDRVGRVNESGRVQLVHGVGLDKSPELPLKSGEIVLAYDIEFQRKAGHWDRKLKNYFSVSLKDLEVVFPAELKKDRRSFWDDQRRRPRVLESLYFKDLALEAGREIEPDEDAKNSALANYIQSQLPEFRRKFTNFDRFLLRLEFMANWFPEDFDVDFEGSDFFEHLKLFMTEHRKIDDIGEGRLNEIFKAFLSPEQNRRLNKEAPDSVTLASRPAKPFVLRYEAPDRVVISGRIRDFTGVTQLPALAGGKVKMLAELLAPNYRPVQITSDLAGFWVRTYPEVKKELKARYPKHFPD